MELIGSSDFGSAMVENSVQNLVKIAISHLDELAMIISNRAIVRCLKTYSGCLSSGVIRD